MSNYSDQIRNSGLMETYWDNHIDEQEAKLEKQKEALIPREILQPLYEKWNYENPKAITAESFYNFLLRQTK